MRQRVSGSAVDGGGQGAGGGEEEQRGVEPHGGLVGVWVRLERTEARRERWRWCASCPRRPRLRAMGLDVEFDGLPNVVGCRGCHG